MSRRKRRRVAPRKCPSHVSSQQNEQEKVVEKEKTSPPVGSDLQSPPPVEQTSFFRAVSDRMRVLAPTALAASLLGAARQGIEYAIQVLVTLLL